MEFPAQIPGDVPILRSDDRGPRPHEKRMIITEITTRLCVEWIRVYGQVNGQSTPPKVEDVAKFLNKVGEEVSSLLGWK